MKPLMSDTFMSHIFLKTSVCILNAAWYYCRKLLCNTITLYLENKTVQISTIWVYFIVRFSEVLLYSFVRSERMKNGMNKWIQTFIYPFFHKSNTCSRSICSTIKENGSLIHSNVEIKDFLKQLYYLKISVCECHLCVLTRMKPSFVTVV